MIPVAANGLTWFGEHRKASTANAGFWAALANGVTALISLIGTIGMSRLLEPSEVGLFSLAFTFYSIPSLIFGPALTSAAVQAHHLTQQQASNLFWVNTALNGMMAITLIGASPWLADFFHQPQLNALCPAFAVVLVLEGIATQYRALLHRAMRFDILAKIQIPISAITLALALVMAWLGFGIWALMVQILVSALADRFAMATVVGWRPSLFVRGAGIRHLLHFSAGSSLALAMHIIYAQSQSLLMGRYASVTEVGYYNRGQSLFQKPLAQFMGPLWAVLLPAMAARQHASAELGQAVYRANSVLFTLLPPILSWMVVSGPEIAEALLGPRWQPAGVSLRFFAIGSVPMILFGAIYRMYEAVGSPAWGLQLRAIFLPIFLLALIAAAPHGAVWMAGASAAVELASAPCFLVLLLRNNLIPPHYYIGSFVAFTVTFAATAATLSVVNCMFLESWLSPGWRAAATALLSTIFGLGFAAVFQAGRNGIRELLSLTKTVFLSANEVVR